MNGLIRSHLNDGGAEGGGGGGGAGVVCGGGQLLKVSVCVCAAVKGEGEKGVCSRNIK